MHKNTPHDYEYISAFYIFLFNGYIAKASTFYEVSKKHIQSAVSAGAVLRPGASLAPGKSKQFNDGEGGPRFLTAPSYTRLQKMICASFFENIFLHPLVFEILTSKKYGLPTVK